MAIEGPMEVSLILLGKTFASNDMSIVILKNTTGGIQQVMNIFRLADIRDGKGTDHIRAQGFLFVRLAPINIRASSNTSCI